MANPYREPPRVEPACGAGGNLGLSTVIFGFLCVLAGHALGGPGVGLAATLAGVYLILAPTRPPR